MTPEAHSPTLPEAISIAQFSKQYNIPQRQTYRLLETMPSGIKIKLGHRIRLLVEPLKVWLLAGGHNSVSGIPVPELAAEKQSQLL